LKGKYKGLRGGGKKEKEKKGTPSPKMQYRSDIMFLFGLLNVVLGFVSVE